MRDPAVPHADDAPEREKASTTAASGAVGTVAAFLPHVLHHAGLIAGAAFLSGLAGGVVFAVLGLAAIMPIGMRLHRRTGSWRVPLVAVAAFVAMFAVMTAVTYSM